jgi:hypothetical protein
VSVVKEIVLMEFRRQPDLFERGLQAASSRQQAVFWNSL